MKTKDEINIGPEIAPGTHVAMRRDENGEKEYQRRFREQLT